MNVSKMLYGLNGTKLKGKVDINRFLQGYYSIIPKDIDDYYSNLFASLNKVFVDSKKMVSDDSGVDLSTSDDIEFSEERIESLRRELLGILDIYENTSRVDWDFLQSKFMEFLSLLKLRNDKRIIEEKQNGKNVLAQNIEKLKDIIDLMPLDDDVPDFSTALEKLRKMKLFDDDRYNSFITDFAELRYTSFGRILDLALNMLDEYDTKGQCLELDAKERLSLAIMDPISKGFLRSLANPDDIDDNSSAMEHFSHLLEGINSTPLFNPAKLDPLVCDYLDLAYEVRNNGKSSVRVLCE